MKDATRNYSQDFMYMEISSLTHDPLCFPFLFLLQDNGVFQYLSTYHFFLANKVMDAMISGFFVWVFDVYYETLPTI